MSEMTFHLDAFDGPLDLLLHLIAKNKVSIYDIPIASILEQYLEILHAAEGMDLDVAGDFIAMAAQLVYIKSRMLLPQPETGADEDPRAELVETLLEYQRIREMTPYFRAQTDRGRDIFVKEPEPQQGRPAVAYCHKPADLVRAARAMLEKAQRRLPPPASAFSGIVGREPVPVGGKIAAILKKFLSRSRLRFQSLFEGARSRSEVVATFLAVLELSKTRRVAIEGEGDDVTLRLLEDEPYDPT